MISVQNMRERTENSKTGSPGPLLKTRPIWQKQRIEIALVPYIPVIGYKQVRSLSQFNVDLNILAQLSK